MKREEMIKRYEDIVLNIHGKAGDEERADYILALCRITQLICQLYQPEQDTKWQKLKEWILDIWKQDLSKELSNGSKYSTKHLIHPEKLLYKMQELEGEDE